MRLSREDLFCQIEDLLPFVEKPVRYIDHELGVPKSFDGPFHVCLCYPDVYEVGMPNVGLPILYGELNAQEGISCERVYLPWVDMADLMREKGVPLLALESAAPVASFDVVGFHLAHELACSNVLEALDLAGIPLRADERPEDEAIILAGGPSVWNCEPLAPMFDAVLLGDGEGQISKVCRCIRDAREEGVARADILRRLAAIPGVYVPSLYRLVHDETDATPWGHVVPMDGEDVAPTVYKNVIDDLSLTDPIPQRIVPYMQIVQDRLALEVLRGCARGCRFCQAGMTYRPVRERPSQQVVDACVRGLATSGYNEVSLTSLSTTDHSQCREILHDIYGRIKGTGTRVSIPSQRLDSFGVDMAKEIGSSRKGSLTFAPEAGTQRLRDVINKNVTEQDIDRAAENAFENGWNRLKLYFMMGLPTETDEDIVAIANTAMRVLNIGRETVSKARRGKLGVSVSVSVFVPKAYTAFQWSGQLHPDEVHRRQQLLLSSTPDRNVKISCHDVETSLVEGAVSKMGREGFDFLLEAWRRGARFDAWTDCFDYARWDGAARACGFDLVEVACSDTPLEGTLPWEHTSPGVSMGYLRREWRRACEGVRTPDCTMTSCTGCGVCPTLGTQNLIRGVRA